MIPVYSFTRVRSTTTKCTRGRGCNGHPAFPTPSLGGKFINASGALRGEDANVRLDVIASAAKQSILSLARQDGLLRFARNDGAARWIASRSLSWGAHSRDPLACNDGTDRRECAAGERLFVA